MLILNISKASGLVSVKPSEIQRSPKNGKDWYGMSLAVFAEFMEKNGKKKAK